MSAKARRILALFGSVVLLCTITSCIGEKPAFDQKTGAPWKRQKWVQVVAEPPLAIPTRYLSDCSFAGSIDHEDRLPVVAEVGTTGAPVYLQYASFSRLHVPEGPVDRIAATLSYPIAATASVRTRSGGILRTSKRIEYVEVHLWQESQGVVSVHERRNDELLVRPPRKIVPQGRPPLKLAYQELIPCSEAVLSPVSFHAEDNTSGLAGRALLHDSPNGSIVAEVGAAGDPVEVRTRDGDWLQIAGLDAEYRYEGWVTKDSVSKESLVPRFGFSGAKRRASHRAVRDTRLSLNYKMSDDGLVLPRGQAVYVAEVRRGVARVFVPHIRPVNGGAFFVHTRGLAAL